MIKTTRWTLAAGLIVALAGCAEREPEPEVAETPEGAAENTVAPGDLANWDVRFDDPAGEPGAYKMTEADGGWTFVTGPTGSAVTWRPSDLWESSPFTVAAAFEQTDAPADHTEAYGLFVGGQNLQAPDQRYTYFLVRGSGDYLIKRRDGTATPTLVDWTPSPAVKRIAAGGTALNTLEIRVEADTTRFFVNGTEVHALPTESVEPYGLAGLRVNHMLNVTVRDVRLGGPQLGTPVGGAAGATYPAGAAPETPTPADAAR
jgi:hypothetical protein